MSTFFRLCLNSKTPMTGIGLPITGVFSQTAFDLLEVTVVADDPPHARRREHFSRSRWKTA